MENKELFKIALRYVEKGYNTENLRFGDDLYNKSQEDREICIEMFNEIQDEGLNWAYEHLNTLQ